ncbi:hypothetical protein SKAU_G00047840 [Synaphobranchus kaupii]|uniref:Uncharacterized protein n=1 Tax=Synaphobranchus kaupii TaxID=118154 RepID=A0A9Q1J7A5_SYNKA|nr:hypothetical protein SKAU_G00047840 [Synaphobranchus kaupii]
MERGAWGWRAYAGVPIKSAREELAEILPRRRCSERAGGGRRSAGPITNEITALRQAGFLKSSTSGETAVEVLWRAHPDEHDPHLRSAHEVLRELAAVRAQRPAVHLPSRFPFAIPVRRQELHWYFF